MALKPTFRSIPQDVREWDRFFRELTITSESFEYEQTDAERVLGINPSNKRYPPGHVKRYGAIGNGSADDTRAIQNALDAAKRGRHRCYAPGGFYLCSQLLVPNGVIFEGDGIGEYGAPTDTDNVTVILQDSGVNDDLIIFRTDFVDGFERLQNGIIRNMVLRGNPANTAGNGISFRGEGDRDDDTNHAIVAGTFQLDQLLIRGFPEHGVHARRALVGNTTWTNVGAYFNGGYGLNVECITNLGTLTLVNCGGDGNAGGAAINLQTNYRDAHVTVIGTFAEYRTNTEYGVTTGFAAAQPYGIRIGNFGTVANDGVVTIVGLYTMSSYNTSSTTREGPDAAILLAHTADNRLPRINCIGIQVVNETTPTVTSGNCSALYDSLNNVRIPSTVKHFTYLRSNGSVAGHTGEGHVVFGGTGEFAPIAVGDNGVQVRGGTPSYSWRETDADSNEGTWNLIASAGELSLRLVNDAGNSQSTAWLMGRSGTTLGTWSVNTPVNFTGGAIFTGSNLRVVVGDTGAFTSPLTGDNGVQVRGGTPFFSWRETDADPDEGTWNLIASAGELSIRSVSDDGLTQNLLLVLGRNGASGTTIRGNIPYHAPDGTVSACAFSFSSDANTGLIRAGDNDLGLVAGGTTYVRVTTSGLRLDNHTTGTTAPAAGGADALPATPAGYLTVNIGGTNRQIPYY